MDAIDEIKAKGLPYQDDESGLIRLAILDLATRLAALERTVKDYKEAVDAITAWADGRDREAYEKAIKEIPDKADRAEIVEEE